MHPPVRLPWYWLRGGRRAVANEAVFKRLLEGDFNRRGTSAFFRQR